MHGYTATAHLIAVFSSWLNNESSITHCCKKKKKGGNWVMAFSTVSSFGRIVHLDFGQLWEFDFYFHSFSQPKSTSVEYPVARRFPTVSRYTIALHPVFLAHQDNFGATIGQTWGGNSLWHYTPYYYHRRHVSKKSAQQSADTFGAHFSVQKYRRPISNVLMIFNSRRFLFSGRLSSQMEFRSIKSRLCVRRGDRISDSW